jgi:hypothetical protein
MGRNWSWSYQKGRETRINAEIAVIEGASQSAVAGLHSHDATMQAYFLRGWASVTLAEVYREHLARQGLLKPKPPRENKEYLWNQ